MEALFSILGVISLLGLFVAPIVVLIKSRGKKGKLKRVLKVEGVLFAVFIICMVLTPVDENAQRIAEYQKQQRVEAKAQEVEQKAKAEAEKKAQEEAKKAEEERLAKLTQEQRDAEAKAKAEAEAKALKQARLVAEKKAEAVRIAEKKAKKKAEATAKQEAFNSWVNSQFSAWDGSCTALVNLVKDNMNDPASYKHGKTTYKVDNLKGFTVYMEFRGTNAFGGVIRNNVTAYCDYKKQIITITGQNK